MSTFQARPGVERVTVLRLLFPLAWTAVIMWLSGESWSASDTGLVVPFLHSWLPWVSLEQLEALHWLIRKAAHVSEYAVLAALWRWALLRRVSASWAVALGLAVLTAGLDELHQSTTVTRTGSIADVLLDSAGAGVGLLALSAGPATIDRMIGALLWITLIGGGALLALNWAVGTPSSPWFWLSVPAAGIGLAVRRRTRRA